jgi:eukaryotic-like serine/threonine-protein kinase
VDLRGRIIDSRYVIGALLGEGVDARVYCAMDRHLGRPVAIKLLRSELCGDPTLIERFEREARGAGRLGHPNVVGVYDYGWALGTCYLVMEYVRGGDLRAHLRAGVPWPPEVAIQLAAEVAEALGAAHARGLVHRDVKPANILLTEDGHAKLTDFGIAKVLDVPALTSNSELLGTPYYFAPEQASGAPVGPSTDVYALGVILYEMLAGRRPFEGKGLVQVAMQQLHQPPPPLVEYNPTVTPELGALVAQALAKDPAQRFADGAVFATALRAQARALNANWGAQAVLVDPEPMAVACRPLALPALALSHSEEPPAPAVRPGPPAAQPPALRSRVIRQRRAGASRSLALVAAGLALFFGGLGIVPTLLGNPAAESPVVAEAPPAEPVPPAPAVSERPPLATDGEKRLVTLNAAPVAPTRAAPVPARAPDRAPAPVVAEGRPGGAAPGTAPATAPVVSAPAPAVVLHTAPRAEPTTARVAVESAERVPSEPGAEPGAEASEVALPIEQPSATPPQAIEAAAAPPAAPVAAPAPAPKPRTARASEPAVPAGMVPFPVGWWPGPPGLILPGPLPPGPPPGLTPPGMVPPGIAAPLPARQPAAAVNTRQGQRRP